MDWSDRGVRLFAYCVVMAAFSSVAVALRFISRGRILHVLGPSDWFLALTLLSSIANTAIVGAHVAHGLGWPVTKLTLAQRQSALEFRKATYVVLGAVILQGLAMTMTNIFVCTPIHLYWDLELPRDGCINSLLKFYLDNGLNFLFDTVLLLLPLPLIWPMSLPWRQRLWLGFLFVLGFSVCAVSALRAAFLRGDMLQTDYSQAAVRIVYWSITEINLSIVIACIPTLVPLAARLYPGLVMARRAKGSADGRPLTIPSAPVRLRSVEHSAEHVGL
ncbi:hypothetical protein C8A01DRAFT_40011 [Parachaetomium inaequale]|uniref:Rhodopsin domain-containing protein n=1 Tax=Parachaetomium inaequale TaxID=2588326 RepID=A0AAN6PA06_9PEZI|nr:hypothetical protein C8A01DRAFT_40011 [Parachaetomium inaequale]